LIFLPWRGQKAQRIDDVFRLRSAEALWPPGPIGRAAWQSAAAGTLPERALEAIEVGAGLGHLSARELGGDFAKLGGELAQVQAAVAQSACTAELLEA